MRQPEGLKIEIPRLRIRAQRPGFTLIESLLVVAVIGILTSVSIYSFSQVRRAGRDTKRRADIANISLAFQAHFNDKSCGASFYPGQTTVAAQGQWLPVKNLSAYSDSCGPFTQYLTIFPTDPTFENGIPGLPDVGPYRFNLPDKTQAPAEHFRLAARLEKPDTSQDQLERSRMEQTWTGSFYGSSFPIGYTYFSGN